VLTDLLEGKIFEQSRRRFGGEHPVVHIASHFAFRPGDDTNSSPIKPAQASGHDGSLIASVAQWPFANSLLEPPLSM
jgi:hypothetical protein